MNLTDIIGLRTPRNLSKIILFFMAIAISSFAKEGIIFNALSLKWGLELRDYLALSSLILIFFINEDILNPPRIFHNKMLTKLIYYAILIILAISISSFGFNFPILNIHVSNLEYFTIRNILAVLLLFIMGVIHKSG